MVKTISPYQLPKIVQWILTSCTAYRDRTQIVIHLKNRRTTPSVCAAVSSQLASLKSLYWDARFCCIPRMKSHDLPSTSAATSHPAGPKVQGIVVPNAYCPFHFRHSCPDPARSCPLQQEISPVQENTNFAHLLTFTRSTFVRLNTSSLATIREDRRLPANAKNGILTYHEHIHVHSSWMEISIELASRAHINRSLTTCNVISGGSLERTYRSVPGIQHITVRKTPCVILSERMRRLCNTRCKCELLTETV